MYQTKFVVGLAVVGGILAIGLGTPAFADEAANTAKLVPEAIPATNPADRGMAGTDANAFVPKLQRADHLIGMKVQNAKGEDLGKLEDLVLGPHLQRAGFAILGSGGIVGLGEKLYAIPFGALDIRPDTKLVILDLDKTKLAQAPQFDNQHWPDFSNRDWVKSVHDFYGRESTHYADYLKNLRGELRAMVGMGMEGTPTTMPAQTVRERAADNMGAAYSLDYRRVSKLMGMDVKNAANEKLGDIRNLMVDLNHGVIGYAVTGYGGVAGISQTLAPVPWTAIQFKPDQKYAIVNTDKAALDAVAFKGSTYPNFNDRAYAMGIDQKFDQEPYWEMLGYAGAQTGSIKPWAADSEYNKLFDADKIVTVSGATDKVGTFRPMAGAREGLRLVVTGDDGKTYTVHVGPKAFADQQNFVCRNGDKVTVTGSSVKFNDSEVIIVTEIRKGGQTLTVRDKEGKPAWNAEQLWPSSGTERKGMDSGAGSSGNTGDKSYLGLPAPCSK